MGVTNRSPSGDRRAEMERQQLEQQREAQAAAAATRAAAGGGAPRSEQIRPTDDREDTPQSVLLMPRTPRRAPERLARGQEPGPSAPLPDPGAASLPGSPARADAILTLNHESRAAPPSSAPVLKERRRSSRASVASRTSMVELRRQIAQQESQRKLIEISRRELQIERELLELDHQIELSQLEIEKKETGSSSSIKSMVNITINDWPEENHTNVNVSDNNETSPDADGGGPRASAPRPPRHAVPTLAHAPRAEAERARPAQPPLQSTPGTRRVRTPPARPVEVRDRTCERRQYEVCNNKVQCADYCRCSSREQSSGATASLEQVMTQLVALNSRPTSSKQVWDLPVFTGLPSEWITFYTAYTESSSRYKFTNWENLSRLRHCLKGEARDCVLHMLASSADPELILRVLKKNFGRSDLLIDKALNELRKLPNLGPSAVDLNDFAIKVVNIVTTLASLDRRAYANNPFLIREITERLSPHVRSRWCEYAEDKLEEAESELTLMVNFLLDISDKELQYSHARGGGIRRGAPAPSREDARGGRRPPASNQLSSGGAVRKYNNNSNRVQTYTTDKTEPCLCCGAVHPATECRRVLNMSVAARWEWAKNNKICFKCLNRKHRRGSCKAGVCGEQGCQHPHHRLLHDESTLLRRELQSSRHADEAASAMPASAPIEPERAQREHTLMMAERLERERAPPAHHFVLSTEHQEQSDVLLKVIPILLSGPTGEIKCYALCDDGSTISLCEESLANAVGAVGVEAPLHINGIGPMTSIEPSRRVTVQIRGLIEGHTHLVQLRTVKDLGINSQQVPRTLIDRYKHLRGLREATYDTATPRVLIGSDNWHMILPLETRVGARNEPAAVKIDLGWVIYGRAPQTPRRAERVLHLSQASERDGELNKQLQRYFEIDSLGIKLIDKVRPQDERAQRLFNDTVKQVSTPEGPRYEVGQLWRDDDPRLPPSYNMALTRLRGIERKMDRDPSFAAKYIAQVDNLLNKGYAERVSEPGPDPGSYYLPHFSVTNPNKPKKIRLVFDAAALNQGQSLNDFILEGPDMLQSLIGIMLRFREGAFAVTADVEEMFLWRAARRSGAPDMYRMKSMVFGIASSPFLAHSVRNYNAYAQENRYPRALEDIVRNHYMDDYVSSYENEADAIACAEEVSACHQQAGFHLRGWSSNSALLIERIPEELRADTHTPAPIGDKEQKVLGLIWDARTDHLGFNTTMIRVPSEVKELKRAPTKRETLSAVMSIYDPLGIISYFSITVKIQLQRLWSLGLDWNAPLPPDECEEFQTWLRALEHVGGLRIPRHYGPMEMVRRTLHIFVDASSQAYAAVAYWRIERRGEVYVTLIAAKAKVGPTRSISIPRAELQSALIGARLKKTILEQHRYEVAEVVMWSDSRTTLHWVRENARRYSAYVSHRLGEIAELTEPEQWRWVPTRQNVADDATRADSTREFDITHRWFQGPAFLRLPATEWPQEPSNQPEPELEVLEVKQCLASREAASPPLPDVSRFSSYDRLLGATARMLQFIDILKSKTKMSLETKHILAAERLLLQRAQNEDFADELRSLRRGEPLTKGSALFELDPELAADNVLRMRGRIDAAPVPINKRPAILHGRNRLARLIIFRMHRRAAHANNERVVNDVRQEYWILRLRPTVRAIASACQFCRIRRANPRAPPMGDLPLSRIEPFCRPFTNTGVDLFGHITVTIGRRHEKRWVALYTCLTTRAVHLELVHSLSTDSAIMSLRRMAARRGWPRTMWSDNGTNFRGATAELRAAYEEWLPALQQYGLQYRMDWRFIPPGAPNQGGAWERMVRSVKTALMATLHSRAPKEEVLATLLAEAEACVNARPLTHVSVDPRDPEALTPNHFLLNGPTGTSLTGPCGEVNRRAWKVSQALADSFWRRWVREILPTLAPRRSSATGERPLAVGDLVIVVDPSLPRNVWPRGVVERVYPGPDGGVRSAEVRTKGGVFRRPTTRLAVLPVDPEST
ncbi:uncharacterized protein LOC134652330 [Cydia amplana]|uniref:uncharacterized protein LOC134652330 n=1 Tax=Cydia amplana TaxID=1869771 RepID=UPI002FE5F1BF